LPAGAYVTLEHEYVLILRKGEKRAFDTEREKALRQESALFWEERNQWFSDVWFDLKGARQDLADKETRKRSGAFPFELPYRLINMYSVKGDTVLDPFLGLGTTMLAAMAAGRNSVGFEIDRNFEGVIEEQIRAIADFANDYIRERLKRHKIFVEDRVLNDKPLKHMNAHYGFPVIMNQEKSLKLDFLRSVEKKKAGCFEVQYADQSGLSDGPMQEPEGAPAGTRQVQLEFKF
jgi:DNA modification methylase